MFTWSLTSGYKAGSVSPQLCGQRRSLLLASFRFQVEPRGFACRPTPRGQAGNAHDVLVWTDVDAQLITQPNRLGRFRALPVNVNLSTRNRLRSHRTCFEKACGP